MIERGVSVSKLNLYLKVVALRPDHYHELNTLFLPLARPADEIVIDYNANSGIHVSCSQAQLPKDLDNLAGRAALAYADATGITPSWLIRIEKRIPIAAGMGGGSSNAGTVLRMLNEHFDLVSPRDLVQLALTLGADVPFFLHPGVAIGSGIGEKLRRVDGMISPPPLLLVNPRFPVSAKWAYMHLNPAQMGVDDEKKLARLIEGLRVGDPQLVAENLHNDLSFALYEKFPLLRMLRKLMLESGALGVEITGSGPTLFAVCESFESRHRVVTELRTQFSEEMLAIFEDIPCVPIEQHDEV